VRAESKDEDPAGVDQVPIIRPATRCPEWRLAGRFDVLNRREIGLNTLLLVTGSVTLSAFVRMLITEFGLRRNGTIGARRWTGRRPRSGTDSVAGGKTSGRPAIAANASAGRLSE
jgi:hypothetical protein